MSWYILPQCVIIVVQGENGSVVLFVGKGCFGVELHVLFDGIERFLVQRLAVGSRFTILPGQVAVDVGFVIPARRLGCILFITEELIDLRFGVVEPVENNEFFTSSISWACRVCTPSNTANARIIRFIISIDFGA